MGKTYNGEFKSDVALVALIGELTVAEISRRSNAPESVVMRWRREGLEHMRDVKKHIQQFVYFYNFKRLHQNLNYNTPNNVYNKIVDGHSFIYAKVEKNRSQK